MFRNSANTLLVTLATAIIILYLPDVFLQVNSGGGGWGGLIFFFMDWGRGPCNLFLNFIGGFMVGWGWWGFGNV